MSWIENGHTLSVYIYSFHGVKYERISPKTSTKMYSASIFVLNPSKGEIICQIAPTRINLSQSSNIWKSYYTPMAVYVTWVRAFSRWCSLGQVSLCITQRIYCAGTGFLLASWRVTLLSRGVETHQVYRKSIPIEGCFPSWQKVVWPPSRLFLNWNRPNDARQYCIISGSRNNPMGSEQLIRICLILSWVKYGLIAWFQMPRPAIAYLILR